MARPKHAHPTPAELEVLRILWNDGPATGREVMDRLETAVKGKKRGYTTVMSLLDVMHEKGLLKRKTQGRAFVYSAKADEAKTLKQMVGDLLSRAFQGSSSALVSHLLDQATPDEEELVAIRSAIEEHERKQEEDR